MTRGYGAASPIKSLQDLASPGYKLGDIRWFDADPGAGWLAAGLTTPYTSDLGAVMPFEIPFAALPLTLNGTFDVRQIGADLVVSGVKSGNDGGIQASQDGGETFPVATTVGTQRNAYYTQLGGGKYFCGLNQGYVSTSSSLSGPFAEVSTGLSTSYPIYGGAYGAGLYILTNTFGQMQSTPDFVTFTSRSPGFSPAGGQGDVIFANNLFVFSVGSSLSTSPDGINWTLRINGAHGFTRVVYVNGMFIAAGTAGVVWFSTDGVNWTQGLTLTTNGAGIASIIYAMGGYFICVGNGSIYFTTDLISNLIQITSSISNNRTAMALVNGKFFRTGLGSNFYERALGVVLAPTPSLKPFTRPNATAYTRIAK